MRIITGLVLAAALLAQGACTEGAGMPAFMGGSERSAAQGALSQQDLRFAEEAAKGGLMEVQLGEIAAERAASPQIAQFGQRMVQDHGQANQQLLAIAQEKQVQLPDSLDQDKQHMVDELGQLSGVEFDRAYIDEMVRDHENDVAAFREQAQAGQDPDLRSFAQQTLPTLEQHLQMAQEIQANLGATGTTRMQ